MRVPLSWLRDFVKVKLTPNKLAERLTMSGVEVEEIIDRRKEFDKVVVGEVVNLKPHPNANKLRLAYITTKPGGKPLEIVCGAPNIAVGQKVPVAVLGAKLPSGMTIEPRKIRGVASQGMVCAEDELGLGTGHAGIMVLDPTLAVGTPLALALGLDDVVFDCAVPANRADLFSIRGIAWEVAAIFGKNFSSRKIQLHESSTSASRSVRVAVAHPRLCSYYSARVIRGVMVQPSPDWLTRRLRLTGIRPVNAVVDATNYIMLEYGQPLHAFDAALVAGGTITVRTARVGESITTLDGKRRALDPSMLVITDSRGPIALAGVMGGAHTEIRSTTSDIILESAIFDPVAIRMTARRLGLQSESSLRFEKGLPRALADVASRAAAALIVQSCGGSVDKGIVASRRRSPKPTIVTTTPLIHSELLGKVVPPTVAKRMLKRLGFAVRASAKSWRVTVPLWRLDVSTPEDLVDEVGRMLGYEGLPDTLPSLSVAPQPVPELIVLKEEIRDILVGFGFSEVMTHAWYGKHWERKVGKQHFAIAHPLDATQHVLRRSFVPHVEDVLEHAADAGEDVALFEIGRVFDPAHGKALEEHQPWKLVLGMCYKPDRGSIAGRKVAGALEALLSALGSTHDSALTVFGFRERKGRIMEWYEVDVATIRDRRHPKRFRATPLYPALYRDVSIWVPPTVPYTRVHDAITTAGKPLLEQSELFDVFEKGGRRSLAFHLSFRTPDRTLTDGEILAIMKAIETKLESIGAELR